MSFEKEFNQEREAVIKATQETVKVVAISLFSGVINSSPVGNPDLWLYNHPERGYIDYVGYLGYPEGYVGGSFRSNWFLSFNGPTDKVTDNKRGKAARLREVAAIESRDYSSEYWLTNNLPYAERIENGWSSQAPAGVIAPNQSRVNARIPRIYAVASRKYGVQ